MIKEEKYWDKFGMRRVKKGQKTVRDPGMVLPAEECLSRWYRVTGLKGLEGEDVLASHNEHTRYFPVQPNKPCDTSDKLFTLSNLNT